MPAGQTWTRRLRAGVVTSRVCGHDYGVLLEPKSSRLYGTDVEGWENRPCTECSSAANRSQWDQHIADAATRGWTRRYDRWFHSCDWPVDSDYAPATCNHC